MYRVFYPMRTFLVVSAGPNVMTADWVVPLSFSPFLVGVAISPKRKTHKNIEEHGEFVIAVPSADMLEDVWVAGTRSGPEKVKEMNVTFVPSKEVSVPSIKEALANVECVVERRITLGDHTFFVGRVVHVSERFLAQGLPDLSKKPVAHVGNNVFTDFDGNRYEVGR